MALQMRRKTFIITVAATGTTFNITVPAGSIHRARAMQMTLVTPNYTTGTPTTTISFIGSDGYTYFTDSARNENITTQVTLGSIVVQGGDTIRAVLSGVAGGIHDIIVILHLEE
jgi:hypothetical protein